MQTLGLSDSTTRSESRLKSLFWPSIQSGADVDYLAVQGFWVCTIVGLLSLVFQVLAGNPITGVVVVLLFHFGGVGVREHNPFAAGIMLAYYVVEFLSSVIFVFANTPGIGVVKIIIMALLLSNLRATWIAAGWNPNSEEAALPPRLGDTLTDKFTDKWPAFIWPKVKVLYYIFSFACLVLIVAGLVVLYLQAGHVRPHA
ncbi:MAG TPA: hypothetical protein VE377_27155 [Candidatus Dormibacteraeota bacterium]|nr:hypothetical protein [Candidatus Dormibacteraeota bacterium]